MKIHAALLCTALLALAGCRSSGPKEPDPETRLELYTELALRYYDLDDLPRAEQQARRGLEIDPNNVTLRLMLGWIRQRRGRTEDILVAEKVFRTLRREDDYRVDLGLAEALERKGVLYVEAAEALESGQREVPGIEPGAKAVELRRESHEAWRESVELYGRVLAVRATDLQATNGLQRVHGLLGDARASLEYSEKLIEITSGELDFWRRQLEREDLTVAEEARLRELLRATLELEVGTHLHAASLLRSLGRIQEAIDHLETLLALRPDYANAYGLRAQLLHSQDRYEEAIASLDEFLRLSELEFDHPSIRRAYDLRTTCEAAIQLLEPTAR